MSEFKMSPDAAAALNDFFDYMHRMKSGSMVTRGDVLDRAQEQAVASTALVSFLMNAYGPETAVEVAAFAAAMLVEITGDVEAAAAGAEVAMLQIEGFLASEITEELAELALPEIAPKTEPLDIDKLLN